MSRINQSRSRFGTHSRIAITAFAAISAIVSFSADPERALAGPRPASPEAPTLRRVSETPTPTPPHTPTPTATATPTVTPTAPPPPQQCSTYKVTAAYFEGVTGVSPYFIPTPNTPSCVTKEVAKATLLCLLSPEVQEKPERIDDCVVYYYFMIPVHGPGYPSGPWTANALYGCHNGSYCDGATFYLDENCKSVKTPSPQQVATACNAGLLSAFITPISLVWEKGHDLEKDLKVASFPLDPQQPGGFYTWKASSKAPLLVYDPEHRGTVTTAFQLFGAWAMGGKPSARLESMVLNDAEPSGPAPWRDGYEALGSLDSDGNGKVEGRELAALALWFDDNRDGVSQAGEVKTLAEANVQTLYYTGAQRDTATRSVSLEVGFERIQNGVPVAGKSIDWHAERAASPAELVQKHLALSAACADTGAVMAGDSPAPAAPVTAAQTSATTALNGSWSWELRSGLKGSPDVQPTGVLVFSDDGSGKIRGHSFSGAQVRKEAFGASTMLNIDGFAGTRMIQADRSVKAEFVTKGRNGTIVHSSAVLSADGKQLVGTSRAEIASTAQTVSYDWVARKM